MLKQFILGVLSSAVSHRLFPPPTNNGKSRGGGCILRLIATLILVGALCWALGYALVVAPTSILLTLYAGLKYLAANGFIALDKLFHPGFDIPAPLAWGGWGLVGGAALQGYRELRGHGRKGMGVLTALAPLLLLGLTGVIKEANVPESGSVKVSPQIEQNTSESERETTHRIETKPATTTQPIGESERKTNARNQFVNTNRQQKTATQSLPKRRSSVNTTQKKNTTPQLPSEPKEPAQLTKGVDRGPTPPPLTGLAPPDMVLIPAGEFQMGSGENTDEQPVHTVYIDAFYMDRYEVTNAQYKRFLDANRQWQKSRISSTYHDGDYLKNWSGNNYPPGKGEHPVTYVSWYAAMAYAEWTGKRLPTEAEWEKAARGGLVGQKYPWGDYIDPAKANYNKNVGGTTFVGKHSSNNYGLYDMAGNVLEWCLDAYDESFYKSSPRQNPIAGSSLSSLITNFSQVTTNRVLRGGSWSTLAQSVRAADRTKGHPTLSYFGAGFRCVKRVTSSGGN